MPSQRTYTIRGQNPATATHRKIQLSSYDPEAQYQIVEFNLWPAAKAGITATNADLWGIITMGKNDTLDPTDADFTSQNEIAWAHHCMSTDSTIPPTGPVISNSEINDDKLFAYDIWLHTEDSLGNSPVNYMLKIIRYDVSSVPASIASLRQYQYNPTEV